MTVLACAILAAVVVLPAGARAVSSQYHDDSFWANSLRSLGGLATPFDLAVFLSAGEAVRHGESPYVDAAVVAEGQPAPYVYPPVLAFLVAPLTLLPETIRGSSTPGILFTLILIACTIGALLALRVRDWRCYPVALLYPVTLENFEYGALGPVLALLVALGWRHRDRVWGAAAAIGAAVVLKVFLCTRRLARGNPQMESRGRCRRSGRRARARLLVRARLPRSHRIPVALEASFRRRG
jgi:hypothetical protein